jgi:L-fuconolactonase
MLGIRVNFGGERRRGSVLDSKFDWLWATAQAQSIPIMVFAPGQTTDLGTLAKRFPDLRLIIDHLNLGQKARNQGVEPSFPELYQLIATENVAVKISALPCYVNEPHPFPSLPRIINEVISRFGADRCMWGSDVTRLPCSYRQWVNTTLEAISDLTDFDQRAVMGGTLSKWLSWPTTATG